MMAAKCLDCGRAITSGGYGYVGGELYCANCLPDQLEVDRLIKEQAREERAKWDRDDPLLRQWHEEHR